MSSINWDREWIVETSNVTWLTKDDKVLFDGSEIKYQKTGSSPASWGTYASTTLTIRTVTTGDGSYTIEYKDTNPDQLICTSQPKKTGLLSLMVGGIAGVVAGLVASLLLDVPCGSALLIATASAAFTAMVSMAFSGVRGTADHGPNGPSWTAIEGG